MTSVVGFMLGLANPLGPATHAVKRAGRKIDF